MKKYLIIFLGLFIFPQSSTSSDLETAPRLVQIEASEVIIPIEFTSDSDVYVIASGVFPNGCYRWSHADVTHPDKLTHEIRLVAGVVEGPCKMVLVPFLQIITLGRFGVGRHSLRFFNHDGTYKEKILDIHQF